MTTEFHDNPDEDTSSFWTKEGPPVSLKSVSTYRRWVCPALTVVVLFALIVSLAVSNSMTWNHLKFMDGKVSKVNISLSNIQQLSTDLQHEILRLRFAVHTLGDQQSSVSVAMKELSSLDSIRRTVASLQCSLQQIMNNGSQGDTCCPLGWEVSGSDCYLFSRDTLSWDDARDQCNAHKAQLAILHTEQDWDFVTRHTFGTFYWIGLSDERTGKWEWINQTPYIMNRRHWRPGQPDSWTRHGLGHGDEDCAHLHSDGRLNDLHCSTRLRYICQRHEQ